MKLPYVLMVFLLFVYHAASATSMTCGTHLIEEGQIVGQTKEEVIKQCGAPLQQYGNDMTYKKGSVIYRLHFNDSDELESIVEEE